MKVIHLIYNHYPGSIPQALVHYLEHSATVSQDYVKIRSHFNSFWNKMGYFPSILHFKKCVIVDIAADMSWNWAFCHKSRN